MGGKRRWLIGLLIVLLVSCVTVNIYFPAAAIQKAADQIVDVKLRRGPPGAIRLVVEDEGEGIPEAQREEVFSPYARLERHRASGIAGSGIGLAVVRELARRQGGRVWVEEAFGGGAGFVVELPQAEPRPEGSCLPAPEPPVGSPSPGD